MAITYAGVPLPVQTQKVSDWVKDNIPLDHIINWERPDEAGKNRYFWAKELILDLPPVEPGTFHYPTGASRFGLAYFLVTDNILNQIRPQIFQGSGYMAAPLTMSSTSGSITTFMWMLPPRPLAQLPFANGMYLMTLVDDRYWWWFLNTGNITINEPSTTWLSLLNNVLGTVVNSATHGTQFTVDPINAAYLSPSDILTNRYEPAAVFLQTLALNVGHRIVRLLNGTILSQNRVNAANQSTANLNNVTSLWAGGLFGWKNQVTPSVADLNANTPGSITITFPQKVETVPNTSGIFVSDGNTYPIVRQLTSLNLAEYSGITGNAFTKTIHETCAAPKHNATDTLAINDTALQSLATQIATDFYLNNIAGYSLKISGIYPWVPEGRDVIMTWKYTEDEISTSVLRPGWTDSIEEMQHTEQTARSVGVVLPGTWSFPYNTEFGPSSSQEEAGIMTIEGNPQGPLAGGTVQCSSPGATPTGNLVPQYQTVVNYPQGPSHVALQGAELWNAQDKEFWISFGPSTSGAGTAGTQQWIPIGPLWVGDDSMSDPPTGFLHPVTTLKFSGNATVTPYGPNGAQITIGGGGGGSDCRTDPNFCYCVSNCCTAIQSCLDCNWLTALLYICGPFTNPPPTILRHNLLSTMHPDTNPFSPPTNGDLVVGYAGLWNDFTGWTGSNRLFLSETNGVAQWFPGTIYAVGCNCMPPPCSAPPIQGPEPLLEFGISTNIFVQVFDNPAAQLLFLQAYWFGMYVTGFTNGQFTGIPGQQIVELHWGNEFNIGTEPSNIQIQCNQDFISQALTIQLDKCNVQSNCVPFTGNIAVLVDVVFNPVNCTLQKVYSQITICKGRVISFGVDANGNPVCPYTACPDLLLC